MPSFCGLGHKNKIIKDCRSIEVPYKSISIKSLCLQTYYDLLLFLVVLWNDISYNFIADVQDWVLCDLGTYFLILIYFPFTSIKFVCKSIVIVCLLQIYSFIYTTFLFISSSIHAFFIYSRPISLYKSPSALQAWWQ